MDRALSFVISAGIAGFGIWIIAGAVAPGWLSAWTFLGILPVLVGSISLYQAIAESGPA